MANSGHVFLVAPEAAWMKFAACHDEPIDLFFPTQQDVIAARNRREPLPAVAICNTCIHQSTCLDYAITNGLDEGIWGGTLERERMRLRRARQKARVATG